MLPHHYMVLVSIAGIVGFCVFITFYKYVFPKKNIRPIPLIFFISLIPLLNLIKPGVPNSNDFALHTSLLTSFVSNFSQGNFFPMWADSAGGYGYPAFVFMYQLPYYIGVFYSILGFSVVDSVKLILITAYIISGIGMYLWMKEEFDEWSGVIAAVFYLFAPYHLITLHIFTSLGESVAFATLPFAFLFLKKYFISRENKYFVLTAFSYALIILSHQTAAIISLPLICMYILVLNRKSSDLNLIIKSFGSIIAGIALTSYYWLPIIFEAKFVSQGSNPHLNSVEIEPFANFFYSSSLYGLLFQNSEGKISFILGYAQWIVVLLIVFMILKKLVNKSRIPISIYFISSFIVLFILMQDVSKHFWELPLFNNFRQANRLLLFEALITSGMAALLFNQKENLIKVIKVNKKRVKIVSNTLIAGLVIVCVLSTVLNWGNRITNYDLTDKLSLGKYREISDHSLFPVWFIQNEKWYDLLRYNQGYKSIEIIEDKARIREISRSITSHKYFIKSDTGALIKENTAYYPGWKVKIDDREVPISYPDGIITFKVPAGENKVEVLYEQTPIRSLGNIISILALILILILSPRVFSEKNNIFINLSAT